MDLLHAERIALSEQLVCCEEEGWDVVLCNSLSGSGHRLRATGKFGKVARDSSLLAMVGGSLAQAWRAGTEDRCCPGPRERRGRELRTRNNARQGQRGRERAIIGSSRAVAASSSRETVVLLQHSQDFYTAPHRWADCLVAYQRILTNWGRVMTISSLLSREQIRHFGAVEITDADFNRVEIIGDLIHHIETVDSERRQHEAKMERLQIVQPPGAS